jgi:uncharacterized protein (DUF2252 family)
LKERDQRHKRQAEMDEGSLEFWQKPGPYDPHVELGTSAERRAAGKAIRKVVPREAHAGWQAPANRPDPVGVVLASNKHRQPHLVSLRMERMAASPFNFLRGSAAIMAWDLAHTPHSNLPVVIDGDAHLGNFGLYGSPQGDVMFDLNDFDGTTIGAWEWDLKRLVASVNVVARGKGFKNSARRRAAMDCVRAYRLTAARLYDMGIMPIWYQHAYPGAKHSLVKWELKKHDVFKEAAQHAAQHNSEQLLKRVAKKENSDWLFVPDPPILTIVDKATVRAVEQAIAQYVETLLPERRFMMKRYHVVDVAHRIVGVGSVGIRSYLVLLIGAGDSDPLFLQVKEALPSAFVAMAPPVPAQLKHEGRRVVFGQRLMQAASDALLGWTSLDGRDFYVRQMRNLKGTIDVESLSRGSFHSYSWACGALLARAHARTGDIAKIAGYCGNSTALDHALAEFAEAYGDQTEADYNALLTAIKKGRVKTDGAKARR